MQLSTTRETPESARFPYKWIVAIVVMFGAFISILDQTIVNIALPQLQHTFRADLSSVQWVLTAYSWHAEWAFLRRVFLLNVDSSHWRPSISLMTDGGWHHAGTWVQQLASFTSTSSEASCIQDLQSRSLHAFWNSLLYGHATVAFVFPLRVSPCLRGFCSLPLL